MKKGIIYKATSPSAKVYIGQTTLPLRSRISKHRAKAYDEKSILYSTKFYHAVRKYGIEGFIWEVVYKDVPEKDLDKLEIETIEKYNSFNFGYNGTLGGKGTSGHEVSDTMKQKISKIHKGKILSKETRQKISEAEKGENNPFFGRKHSSGTKLKIGASSRNRKHTEKSKKKMSEKRKGALNPRAKLDYNKVQEIRKKFSEGLSYIELAKEFGVSSSLIGMIIRNKLWR